MTTDTAYKVSRPDGYGLKTETNPNGETWHHGTVRTRHGYVYAYSEEKHTTLSIIHDGYDCTRTMRRGYSRQGLTTMAQRYAEEICG